MTLQCQVARRFDGDVKLLELLHECPVALSVAREGEGVLGWTRWAIPPVSDDESEVNEGITWELNQFHMAHIGRCMQTSVEGIDWGYFDHLCWEESGALRIAQLVFAEHPNNAYIGVSSDLNWRFRHCSEAGWVPHHVRFAFLCPLIYGPSERIAQLERNFKRLFGLSSLQNRSRGGERVGAGYHVYLYYAHSWSVVCEFVGAEACFECFIGAD